MTTVVEVRAAVLPPVDAVRRAPRLREPIIAIAILVLALALRFVGHSTNYELFVDEITYSNIGLAIASGKGAVLYGQPFFLHPPGLMYVLAGAMSLFGRSTGTLSLVMQLRVVNAVIGTIGVAMMMCLVKRVAGRVWAAGAGIFLALEPFVLLYDGRVMLETLAMTAAAAGMLSLVILAERLGVSRQERSRHSLSAYRADIALAVGAGVAFGAAVFTKESYVFVGIVPVGVLLITGRFIPRRWSAGILFTAIGCYAAYIATVLVSGRGTQWWEQLHAGLLRAVGAKQISGFNQAGHVGFASRLFATASNYAGTYALMALAAAAVIWGVWRWWRASRRRGQVAVHDVLTLWAACAAFYVAFAAVRGAFEQQIFYPFVVAGVPATVVALRAWTRRPLSTPRARLLALATATLVAVVLVYDTAVDVRVRTQTDAAYSNTVQWMDRHARTTDLVDATDGVSQFVLRGTQIDTVSSLAGVLRDKPDYVIFSRALVDQGYVRLTGGLQGYLERAGKVVHRAYDKSAIGPLVVYRLKWPSSGKRTE